MLIKAKNDLRCHLKMRRQAISLQQKKSASHWQTQQFQNSIGNLLSFASFKDEIDLWELNGLLAKKRQLILPKVDGKELKLYKVESFSDQLISSKWGILEPIPEKCESVAPEEINIALIPGLGFDQQKRRIGYGKGHYDRLIPQLVSASKIGVCFKEQVLEIEIPTGPYDQSVEMLSAGG